MRRATTPRVIRATLRDWHSDPSHQEIEELEPDAAPTDYREAGFKNNDRVRVVPEALWREMRRELKGLRVQIRQLRAVIEDLQAGRDGLTDVQRVVRAILRSP